MPHAYVVATMSAQGFGRLFHSPLLAPSLLICFRTGMEKSGVIPATIPIAVITNVIRVVFLAFVAEVWGHEAATGFVHDFSGFAIFGIAFLFLLATAKLLE
jgi:exosortase/archaeosortase family protein